MLAQAVAEIFRRRRAELGGPQGDRLTELGSFINAHLSDGHRDDLTVGCPVATLAGDVVRSDDQRLREAVAAGVEDLAGRVARLSGRSGARDDELADVVLLVGALILARATASTELSEQLLTAARHRLLGTTKDMRVRD